ncbi:MAG: [FeFe] hydrogenase H-cluster radical SAM maturase HydE [Lentisphaerae bacterium]|nr:[FeFe] hydrogenase H-cluster radical SAM maturase HydE [Lentisphaerota bacterium]
MNYEELLRRTAAGAAPDTAEIARLLQAPDEAAEQALFAAAYEVKKEYCSNLVNLRGLIEFSNICTRDCLYCGIRKSNRKVSRYQMSIDEIVAAARCAGEFGYGSVVLQSGERSDPEFVEQVTEILRQIAALPWDLGVTLSCGEQSPETYRQWREAGAKRYLLRIESSDPEIFARIHPPECHYRDRVAALERLKTAGYQVGTGVMIGLPEQTWEHLAADIDFFRRMDADMIGMGPYLPQDDTPLGVQHPDLPGMAEQRLQMALRMIAVTRLVLRDVNIAATTALQAIDPESGRERGILAGANVIMPNVGDVAHRRDYQLYNGKPDLDENSAQVRQKLLDSLARIGERPRFNAHGDPEHFFTRMKQR